LEPAHRPLRAAAPVAALLACGAAACARVEAPRMSFAEAGLLSPAVEPEGVVPPAPPAAIPQSIAAEPVEGPPIDPVLLRFATEARARRQGAPAGGFPPEAADAWRALAADLDRYLARALPQTPLLEVVRARVTVETEWDYDVRRFGAPPPDVARLFADRQRRFALRVDAARALGLVMFSRPPPARLAWPILGAGLSSLFGARTDPFDGHRRMHYGVDLAADMGRVVTAAAKGYVVRSGYAPGYGLLVEVRHAGDVVTRYAHLSRALCAPGDAIEPGQALGLVGSTGRSTGPHLHFEVWRGGEARDPLAWLGVRAEGDAGN
jgi:murein DD-endopeptidase MepM/ murein hydrolase activator NlpD